MRTKDGARELGAGQQRRRCVGRGRGWGLYLRGKGEEVWECMAFSFFGTCVRVSVTHWSAGTYGDFGVGPLMGLSSARGLGSL